MRRLLPMLVLFGCGKDEPEGPELTTWYYDNDGDGWGDPFGARQLEAPDPELSYTARNGRDCDDVDPEIGGQVGACPREFGGTAAGVTLGDREYFALTDSPRRMEAAAKACEFWGGDLAAPLDTSQAGSVLLMLEALVEDDTPGFFVGVHWTGDLDDGVWQWQTGATVEVPPSPWGLCDPAIDPWDFYPNFSGDHPDEIATVEDDLPALRLVLHPDAPCLGVPAGEDPAEADMLCERERVDPEDYELE